jgi:hypothetical protein
LQDIVKVFLKQGMVRRCPGRAALGIYEIRTRSIGE